MSPVLARWWLLQTGRRLAYLVTVPGEGVADGVDLVVADAATGEEVAGEGLPVAGFATVGVDIVGDLVLVNRLAAGESGEPTEPTFPMVLDLATGELTEVPLAGVGSLARTGARGNRHLALTRAADTAPSLPSPS